MSFQKQGTEHRVNITVILTGLEKSYMRKLALYMEKNRDCGFTVLILDDDPEQMYQFPKGKLFAVGPKQVVDQLCEGHLKHREVHRIYIVSERSDVDEQSVFQYQSCEAIYRLLCRRMEQICTSEMELAGRGIVWQVVTGTVSCTAMLPFALTYAQVLNECEHTLLIVAAGCSGMQTMFEKDREADLTDLLLALRNEKLPSIEAFLSRIADTDCLLPPNNPMVTSEIRKEDIRKMLMMIVQERHYERVVILLDGFPQGSELLFSICSHMICLTDASFAAECRKKEIRNFFETCGGRSEQWSEFAIQDFAADSSGEHLVYEWQQGAPGQKIRKTLGIKWEME